MADPKDERIEELETALRYAVLWLRAARDFDSWIIARTWPDAPDNDEAYYTMAERALAELSAVARLPAEPEQEG